MNIIASNRPFPNRKVLHPILLEQRILEYKPEYIFFPFWSWKVPKEVTDKYKCIGFHTGEINGGSPIQNLIRLGVENTVIRVFRLNDEIDGGEIIDRLPISLLGSLEEIILRQSNLINDYIQKNYQ